MVRGAGSKVIFIEEGERRDDERGMRDDFHVHQFLVIPCWKENRFSSINQINVCAWHSKEKKPPHH